MREMKKTGKEYTRPTVCWFTESNSNINRGNGDTSSFPFLSFIKNSFAV